MEYTFTLLECISKIPFEKEATLNLFNMKMSVLLIKYDHFVSKDLQHNLVSVDTVPCRYHLIIISINMILTMYSLQYCIISFNSQNKCIGHGYDSHVPDKNLKVRSFC